MNNESITNTPSISRRRFLALLTHGGWVAAVGILLYQIGRFLGSPSPDAGPPPVVVAGRLDEFPPGTTTYVAQARAWLRRDSVGVVALDAVCPHLGCLVRQDESQPGFYCPCHGSRFALNGALLQGPAARSLRQLDVRVRPEWEIVVRLR
jgi:cytochrome b6-f complex iron-sulfur subunit